MIHSTEASSSYNISMFCNIAVSILSVGFVANVFSIMCVEFLQCGGLLFYSDVRDSETVAAQFLSRGGFSF